MIFRYDNKNVGFPAGEERRQIVGLNDIYATLCELTGIEVPYFSAQDSVSFANYISDDQQNAPRQELATFAFNYDVSFVLTHFCSHHKLFVECMHSTDLTIYDSTVRRFVSGT